MKVLNGSYGRKVPEGAQPPTHGVYKEADWKLLGELAVPISIHPNFDLAVDRAAKMEVLGCDCVVVCFENAFQGAPDTRAECKNSSGNLDQLILPE